jgi:hypothetical protein
VEAVASGLLAALIDGGARGTRAQRNLPQCYYNSRELVRAGATLLDPIIASFLSNPPHMTDDVGALRPARSRSAEGHGEICRRPLEHDGLRWDRQLLISFVTQRLAARRSSRIREIQNDACRQ